MAAPKIEKLLTPYNFTNKDNAGRIKYIVIHYVGALGGAEANCKYYASKYLGASAHYFVGFNGEVWQSVEDEDIAWHCGASSYKHAECRNSNSIGIEMCVRNKGSQSAESKDWYFEEATVNAAIELTKYLMQKYGVPASNVIRHHDVTGKICPNPYVYNSTKHTWDAFKNAISGRTEQKDSMTKITGKSEATAEQMTAYIKAKNGSVAQSVLDMIPLYLSEGEAENIRGDIAFAQSCLETGNFTFSGSAVELSQNNFCGMLEERKGINNIYMQVVCSNSRYQRMDGRVQDINNAGIVTGLYGRAKESQSIGEVKSFPISEAKLLKLLPEGIEDYIETLDKAKYVTIRQYIGKEDYYVTSANMMSPEGSDYSYAEDVRVSNRLVKAVRAKALDELQVEVDPGDIETSITNIQEQLNTPVEDAVRDKVISSGSVTIDTENLNILVDEKLDINITYVPMGHVREMNLTFAVENPYAAS